MTTNQHPTDLAARTGLPQALRVLLSAYPRADWQKHPNFGEMVRFWMQRHAMFRQLVGILREDTEAHLDTRIGFEDYAPRLAQHAGLLLQELHTHHHVEDSHYFPKLITLDNRLEHGFDLLESDHGAMDALLYDIADGANAVLTPDSTRDQVSVFADRLQGFSGLLERHLTDEEDIIVPVILKTGFSG